MYYLKMRFSLVSLALCLCFSFGAHAAPSVRILGGAAGYANNNRAVPGTNVTDAKTGNTIKQSVLNTGTGATKAASVRTIAPKNAISTTGPRATSSKVNSNASANSERFPGIMTKSNIQSIGKVGTAATGSGQYSSSAGGYNLQDMNDRLGDIEHFLDSDVATSKLSDHYYTKEAAQRYVEERISEIDGNASSIAIRKLREDVDSHENWINEIQTTIQNIQEADGGIYDAHTGEKKSVFFVDTFDANNISWDN